MEAAFYMQIFGTINPPVPATYPPSCKTLSVPSKWQVEVPTQLELLKTLRQFQPEAWN